MKYSSVSKKDFIFGVRLNLSLINVFYNFDQLSPHEIIVLLESLYKIFFQYNLYVVKTNIII
jgi:hypothetical protein